MIVSGDFCLLSYKTAGTDRWNIKSAFLFHQVHDFLCHFSSVLNCCNTGKHSTFHSFCIMGVGGIKTDVTRLKHAEQQTREAVKQSQRGRLIFAIAHVVAERGYSAATRTVPR